MTTLRRLLYTITVLLCTLGTSAQIFSESFDGTTFPPVGWDRAITTGSYNWIRSTSSSSPTASPHSGAGFIKFQSYDATSGSKALLYSAPLDLTARAGRPISLTFWMFRDGTYISNVDYVEVWVNTAKNITGTDAVKIGTVNRNYGLSPVTTSTNGWYQYNFTVPASFTGSTNYIIFNAVSGYGSNMYVDDVVLDYPPNRDLSVTAVTSPVGNTCGTLNLDSVKVNVTNNSAFQAWGYTVKANITGTIGVTPYTLNLSKTMPSTDTLQPGQSVTINMGGMGNTYNGGTLSINAFTFYNQDFTPNNDTMTVSRVFSKRPFGATVTQGTPFKGLLKAGTSVNPDIMKPNDTMVYELTPPTGYTNSQLGVNWAISDLTITTVNGSPISNQDTMSIIGAGNVKLRYIPNSNFTDSTIRLSLTLVDMQTGCSQTYTRYAYVAPMPQFHIEYSGTCLGQTTVFDNFSSIAKGSAGYIWNYGDPNSSDANGYSHTYSAAGTYQVKVTGVNGYGFARDTTFNVIITTPPAISYTVNNACLGDSVAFTANATGSGTMAYEWRFGDGKLANEQNVKHAYTQSGVYYGQLTVTDGNHCVVKKNISATQISIPQTDFTSEGNCAHSSVKFTNTTTGDGNIGYAWDFGDGGNAVDPNPTHQFGSIGDKVITLVATNGFGCSNTAVKTITMEGSPVASFTTANLCDRENVQFTSTSQLPVTGTNNFTWSFGDGDSASGTTASAQHMYNSPGQRQVTLQVSNSNGCASAVNQVVNIRPKPKAAISTISNACSGQAVKFLNGTETMGNDVSYVWLFVP